MEWLRISDYSVAAWQGSKSLGFIFLLALRHAYTNSRTCLVCWDLVSLLPKHRFYVAFLTNARYSASYGHSLHRVFQT